MPKFFNSRSPVVTVMALATVAILSLENSAQATLIAYEGFDYTNSIPLSGMSGGTGWGLAWSTNGSAASGGIIGSSSLSNSVSLAATGLSHTNGNGTIYARQLASMLGNESARTVWFSCLFLGGNAATPNESRLGFYGGVTDGGLPGGYTATASGGLPHPVRVGRAATGADEFSLYNASTIVPSAVAIPRGATNAAAFLLLKFDLNGDTNTADTVELWVNPNPSLGTNGLGAAHASWNAADLDVINGIRFQSGNAGNFLVDEIRIGTTFEDVAPIAVVVVPTLQASLLGGSLNLAWPEAGTSGFNLEGTDNLTPAVWSAVSATLTTNLGTITATVPATNSQSYFRLKK
jgi:hypothetical protein